MPVGSNWVERRSSSQEESRASLAWPVPVLLLCLALAVLGSLRAMHTAAVSPRARQGSLDFSHWRFESRPIVALRGEWEFYWQQLLTPADFSTTTDPRPSALVSFPGAWNGAVVDGQAISGLGYATYRLRIALPAVSEPLALKVPSINTAYRLWVNGELVAEVGKVGRDRLETRPQYLPQILVIPSHTGSLELVLQVANFHHRRGGSRAPISLGVARQIAHRADWEMALTLMMAGALFMLACYHLGLYTLRPHDSLPRCYLGLLCILIGVRLLIVCPCFLVRLFPDFDWGVLNKLEYATMYLGLTAFALFMHSLFPAETPSWVPRACTRVSLAFLLFTALTPVRIFAHLLPVYEVFVALFLIYAGYALIVAARRRREGANVLVGAYLFTALTVANDLVLYQTWWPLLDLSSFGLFVLAMFQSYVIAEKFTRGYASVERMSQRLAAMDRLKDEFLANTSHELRTPLHGIIGIAESLEAGAAGEFTPAQKENLRLIAGSAKRLAGLVNDILDLAKLRHGDIQLQYEEVDMRQLADLVLTLSQPLVGSKPLVLENRIPPGLPPVWGDANRLHQVMHNLVSNAIKFTDSGRVTITAALRHHQLEVVVADTGIGIPQSRWETIFEPFEQGNVEIARKYGGTGLGLGITRYLVQLHGGAIRVESVVGQGSRFIMTLPVRLPGAETPPGPAAPAMAPTSPGAAPTAADPASPAAAALSSPPAQSASHAALLAKPPAPPAAAPLAPSKAVAAAPRVLVADDEPVNLRVVANQLSLLNCVTVTARDGVEALEVFARQGPFDLVILDVMMPRLSGYEVCRRLRREHSPIELPIIMLTARNQAGDTVTGLEAGATDYVVKPFDRAVLAARIRAQLEAQKAARQAIISTRRYEMERHRRHLVEELHNLTTAVTSTLDGHEVCQRLLARLQAVVSFSHALAFGVNPETGPRLHLLAATGAEELAAEKRQLAAEVAERVRETKRVLQPGGYRATPSLGYRGWRCPCSTGMNSGECWCSSPRRLITRPTTCSWSPPMPPRRPSP
jgi:two-component system sensor histidine kinase ChiS